ncbi:unnamed protein product [Timema podura]|uniref:Uncharacterized protein n=1 Tax=Timema podura TaxID=61482 RepID=A0ABN7NK30_TIMPD|nr:unnamed protein product [Timema podura]
MKSGKPFRKNPTEIWTPICPSQVIQSNTQEILDNVTIDVLCQSLSHLATLVRREDLIALHEVLVFRMDVLQQHMAKFSRDAPPEKSALLYTAASHCSTLLQSAGLNTGEHNSAAMLASVFLLDNSNLIE